MSMGAAADRQHAIAISATFTAEPLAGALNYWLRELKLDYRVEFAPYNQIFQALLDPVSVLSTNAGGINAVMLRWEDLGASSFDSTIEELIAALKAATGRGAQKTLLMVCPASPEHTGDPRAEKAEAQLRRELAGLAGLSILTPDQYDQFYRIAETHDADAEKLGHVPYTPVGFAGLATVLARRIDSWLRTPYKVVVLDCDNTLWRGVLGEDGVDGIALDSGYEALQRFMVAQSEAGMLLAVCSKNNSTDVEEVFRVRRDMPLRSDHIVAWRVNWSPKSANLRELAAELNLGIDSFVFLDDSPAECAEVRANCPEVLTIQLPEDPEEIPEFLNHLWVLDHWDVTTDDKNRTAVYLQNLERGRVQKQATNLADFIAGLQLQVTIEPMKAAQLARVSQLTQRTNQFNCTTIRRSEAEVTEFLNNGGECLTVDASDRFGHYGLIGLVLYTTANSAVETDSFLMSCRALGRGIEHRVIQHLGKIAIERGLETVRIPFRPTAKNAPARLFLESIARDNHGETEGGFVVELPAEYAAAVSYRPSDEIAVADDDAPKKAPAAPVTRFRDYARAATTLRHPAALVDEIRRLHAAAAPKRVGSDFNYTGHEPVLARIWGDVLGYEQVGREVNFFEIGGDSLRGVEVISRTIRELANESLTMSTLLQAPTIAEYGRLLSYGGSNEYRCIVPMRKGRNRPPFFCVHGAGGNVLSLRNLAMLMPDDLPFYCLQARGLDGSEPFSTVEETAAHYVDEITRLQPEGPYFIGGGCYGGLVAFEMAQQMARGGLQVGLLAMIDTYNHAYGSLLPRHKVLYHHARFLGQRAAHHVRKLAGVSGSERGAYVAGRLKSLGRRISTALRLASGAIRTEEVGSGPEGVPEADANNQFYMALNRVLNANVQAQARYVPKPYPGHIVLFRAAERAVEPYQDRYLGWGPLALGGIEDYEIPSNHTYIADHPDVAQRIDDCLRREETRYQGAEEHPSLSVQGASD